MNTKNKVVDVLCITAAWILSIVLVLTLFLTPLMLSALSLLKPQTITQAMVDSVKNSLVPAEPSAQYSLTKLSADTASAADSANAIGADMLEDLLGDQASPELLEKLLSSKTVSALLDAYTDDLANAFTGSGKEAKFNSDLLKKIVSENMDEIVEIVREIQPNMSDADMQKLKDMIVSTVEEKADEIVSAFPKPADIRDEIMKSTPELELAFQIMARKNAIKAVIIGIVVLLSGLVFVCRLRGFKGLRWVSVDLFVGGGLNALLCAGLLVGGGLVKQAMSGQELAANIVGSLLSAFTTGMVIRTVVMLVAAGGILTGYIFIKKALAAKAVATEPAAEPVAEISEVPDGV